MRFSAFLRCVMAKLYKPPVSVRGMKNLDRNAFSAEFTVPCIRVPKINGPRHNKLIKRLTPFFLEFREMKSILNGDGDDDIKQTILLDQEILTKKGVNLNTLVDEFNDYCQIGEHPLRLQYENWSPHQVFNAILEAEDEAISTFSQIGHIIQINLRDELEDYKAIIGQVFLDKVQSCRTVVKKLDTVENQFRTLNFEVIAGEPDFVCQAKENNFVFEFDFSKVFWNARLSTEHARLVGTFFKAQHVIYDVCAGVGPFAIPAAKRKLAVLANDLNPDCVEYLKKSAILNKTKLEGIYCMDGVRFITEIAAPDLIKRTLETHSDQEDAAITTAAHFVMNLPAMAVDFLPSFVGLLRKIRGKVPEPSSAEESTATKRIKLSGQWNLPAVNIHCYTFVKGDESYQKKDYEEKAAEKVKEKLNGWDLHDTLVHDVRNVAPNKQMVCVSFKADEKMLLSDVP